MKNLGNEECVSGEEEAMRRKGTKRENETDSKEKTFFRPHTHILTLPSTYSPPLIERTKINFKKERV